MATLDVAQVSAAILGASGSTPSPTVSTTPSPGPSVPDPNSVTPGVAGFLVVFVLAVVTWLLLRNMTGRLRRMRFREQEAQERDAARQQASGGADQQPDDETPPPDDKR